MNNLPRILYKYRNWKDPNHKKLIKRNQIYLSPPKDFNDPFDCRIPQNLFLLDTDEKKARYVDSFIIRDFYEMMQRGDDVSGKIAEFTNRLTNDLANQQSLLERITFEMQDKYFGIFSLSKIWNSIQMWSHYADLHRGYCVGLNTEKLSELSSFGRIGPINYSHKFPLIDPFNREIVSLGFTQIYYKSMGWKYEKEYRFYHNYFPIEAQQNDRILKIKNEVFSEIYLGLTMDETHKKEIIKLASSKKIRVYQIEKKQFEFKLTRKRIE